MTGRERVLKALNHQEPDMVPIDLGGSFVTSIHKYGYENLKKYLGIEAPTEVVRDRALVVKVDSAVQDRLDVDTRMAYPKNPDGWRVKVHEDGSEEDEWGNVWYIPEDADTYFVKTAPFGEEATLEALEKHTWPDPNDPRHVEGLKEQIEKLEKDEKAIILNVGYQFATLSRFMRGFENWMMDLALNPEFVAGLMDRILEVQLEMATHTLSVCGDKVDVIYIAEDLAMQNGPLFSPDTYRKLIKPRQKRLVEHLKKHSKAKIFYHSCGSVVTLIPDLIEVGIDILNPVQVSAAGMDTKELKKNFGKDLTFWGSIDTQHVLPFGSKREVRDEVKKRIDDLAAGGGFVLAAVHNIRPEVPPENIVTMLEAAREFGRY